MTLKSSEDENANPGTLKVFNELPGKRAVWLKAVLRADKMHCVIKGKILASWWIKPD